MTLKVRLTDPSAFVPTRANPTDSGLDLYSLVDVTLGPNETTLIRTGVVFDIPEGFEIQVRPRSGMSFKTPFRIANAPGTVDKGYTGDCSVIGYNCDPVKTLTIKRGDRIAQAVLCPVAIPTLEVVEKLETHEVDRGIQGFGSSGT